MSDPTNQFVSYAFQDLSIKKIKKYAAQYSGVDMSALIGADEDNFPFLLKVDDDYQIIFWNVYNGMMAQLDEDAVRAYAAKEYLLENAYPVFESIVDAEKWADEHKWPRKARD